MVARKARVRRSAGETRSLLVDAGMRHLQDHGIVVGLDQLTLEQACATTGVARSSSHAAWSFDEQFAPQALFQRTVLQTWFAERESTIFADAAQSALLKAYEQRGDALTKGEIVRVTVQAAYEVGHKVGMYAAEPGGDFLSTDLAMRYAVASQPPDERDPEIEAWVRNAELRNREDRIADSYRPLAELLGMEPKPDYGDRAYVLFGISIAALVEGIGMRQRLLPELELDQPVLPTADGEVPAMLVGVTVEALVDVFFQPVGG